MSRRPTTLHRASGLVGAAALALTLTGCGGSDSGSGGSDGGSAEAPSQAELTQLQEQASTDAESVATEVISQAEADGGTLPESADGLGTLSEGNRVGGYEVDGTVAQICVEHVIDGEPVTFGSWYVDVAADPVRSSSLSTGLNAGCS